MKKSFFSLLGMLCLSAALTACGGGGSDSVAPTPTPTPDPTPAPQPTPATSGFELVAGTLDATAPAGAPRCQNGPALGADLADTRRNMGVPSSVYYGYAVSAVGSNGHIYWLSTACGLVEIDPSTGQMQVQPVPQTVDSPRAIAVASDGSVLIADSRSVRGSYPWPFISGSRPAGIWRLKNGALSKVAGFDRPVPLTWSYMFDLGFYSFPFSEDGTGSNATFSYELSGLCAGPNDTFYAYEAPQYGTGNGLDYGAYRKVLLAGTVKTIDRSPGLFVCATNQRVFASLTLSDNSVAYGDLASGQILGSSFTFSDPLYGFGNGLTVNYGFTSYSGRDDLSYLIVTDPKSGTIKLDHWINGPCSNARDCVSGNMDPNPRFQLDNMPYQMPTMPDLIGIDNNNYAYIRAGNALLRYKIPDSVLSN